MKKEKNEIKLRRKMGLFTVVLSVCMIIGPSFIVPQESDAATYTFNKPNTLVSAPVAFQNGNFEQPVCSSATAATQHYVHYYVPDKWYYYDEGNVPGWETIAVAPGDRTNVAANSIQLCLNGYGNAVPNSGSQFAELNTDFSSRLYQYIPTVPGTKLYWSFAHAAYTSAGPDVMNFVLRPSGYVGYAPLASEIQTRATTNYNGTGTATNGATVAPQANHRWVVYSGKYTVPAGQTSTSFEFVAVSAAGGLSHGNFLDSIKFQTGASLIAEKSIYNSQGNRIDGAYDEYGDIVTIKVKVTNWGETDSSRTVLNDQLWTGLEYVSGSGSVTIDGSSAGKVSCSGDAITANIGSDATSSAGGTLAGSVTTGNNLLSSTNSDYGKGKTAIVTFKAKITGAAGSTAKNQAKVTYNDSGYESYNQGGSTAYSTVDYGIDDPDNLTTTDGNFTMNILNTDGSVKKSFKHTNTSDEDSYVNQFTIIDRHVSGTAWVDTDSDGDYSNDSSEIRFANKTVWLQKLDGGSWVTAYDYSGIALSTTTDSNGKYTFKGVPTGTYRVVMDPGDYVSTGGGQGTISPETLSTTGAQGNPENDCEDATINGNAVVVTSSFKFSESSYTPSSPVYYIYNADLGIVDSTGDVTISKDVTGNDFADPNEEFKFTVTVTGLTSSTNDITYTGTGTYANGGTMTFALDGTTGTKSLTMKKGDSIKLKDLPCKAKVTVTETASDDYIASYTYKVGTGSESESKIGSTCTIDSLTGGATTSISFTNTRNDITATAQNIPGGWSTVILLVIILLLAADLLYLYGNKLKRRRKM